MKVISRSKGRSATGAAAYRAGERIEDRRTGLAHDYTRKHGVDHSEILAPDGAPAWVYDRAELWNRVEEGERRKDSQVAREVEIALPRELDAEQQRELATDYARDQFVSRGMVADVCLHHQDGDNPHAHIMLTMRELDGDGFASRKNRDWNDTELLEEWRAEWERHANDALERSGEAERIDHRSLEDQGLERAPTIKMGPAAWALEARGVETERGDLNREITAANDEYESALIELDNYRKEQRRRQTPAEVREDLERQDSERLLATLTRAQNQRQSEIERNIDNAPEVQAAQERIDSLEAQRREALEQQDAARKTFDEQSRAAKEWEDHHPFRATIHARGWKRHDEQAERERAIEEARQQLHDAQDAQKATEAELGDARRAHDAARKEAQPEAERQYREDPARQYEKQVREVYMQKERERQERLREDAERQREQQTERDRERREQEAQRRMQDDQEERETPPPEKLAEHVRKYGHPAYHETAQRTEMSDVSRQMYSEMHDKWQSGGPAAARAHTDQLREHFRENPEEARRFTEDARSVQDTARQDREQQQQRQAEREQAQEQQQDQEHTHEVRGPRQTLPQRNRLKSP